MRKGIIVFIITVLIFVDSALADISFLKKTVILINDKEEVFLQQKYYSQDDVLRIEEEASDIEGNPAVRIYDFQKKKMYTVMLDVKLYMEQNITVQKEELLLETPPEKKYAGYKDMQVVRTKVGEEIIDGHPTVKYEIKVVKKDGKEKNKDEQIYERYYMWLAEDLHEMPVKYEFEMPNDKKKIIEYKEIINGAIDPALFSLPDGYMPISPF